MEDVYAPVDRETSERRPFVFVTFESSAAAEEACDERNHTLGGKDVSACHNSINIFSVFLSYMYIIHATCVMARCYC